MNVILGAGLSGLICGALNAKARIYERNPSSFVTHRALLRFRDDKIARALGLAFRRITVRKAIWYANGEVRPSPRFANWYSRKVRGVLTDNSTWNLDASTRYIAPENLHAILADICGPRVSWDTPVDYPLIASFAPEPIISTIPLPALLPILAIAPPFPFRSAAIVVDRYRVPDADVFQTIYFPDPELALYRATLTGSLLTVESSASIAAELNEVFDAFGIHSAERIEPTHKQSFGKIIPVADAERKALLHRLTIGFNIYSLGRFATWRNILLDDVYDDIFAIRRMMTLSHYDVSLERLREND